LLGALVRNFLDTVLTFYARRHKERRGLSPRAEPSSRCSGPRRTCDSILDGAYQVERHPDAVGEERHLRRRLRHNAAHDRALTRAPSLHATASSRGRAMSCSAPGTARSGWGQGQARLGSGRRPVPIARYHVVGGARRWPSSRPDLARANDPATKSLNRQGWVMACGALPAMPIARARACVSTSPSDRDGAALARARAPRDVPRSRPRELWRAAPALRRGRVP